MKFIKLFTDELKNKGLSLYDKAVYGSLQTKYQYHGNQEFYTFESYIADELEISERTVKRSIKKLNETGLISITKRYHKQLKQVVNYYNLDIQETADNMRETDVIIEPVKHPITDVITADSDKDITPTDIMPQNAFIQPTDTITDITTDIDADMNKDTYILPDFADIDFRTDKERIAEAIEDKYNVELQHINAIRDIRATMLYDVADTLGVDPQKVLDYIKDVRKIP